MSDKPLVELDFKVHVCPRHLEPFRDTWPAGAGIFLIRLFQAAVEDDRILAAAPRMRDGTRNADALNALMLEWSPLCCFLGDHAIEPFYTDLGVQPPA